MSKYSNNTKALFLYGKYSDKLLVLFSETHILQIISLSKFFIITFNDYSFITVQDLNNKRT